MLFHFYTTFFCVWESTNSWYHFCGNFVYLFFRYVLILHLSFLYIKLYAFDDIRERIKGKFVQFLVFYLLFYASICVKFLAQVKLEKSKFEQKNGTRHFQPENLGFLFNCIKLLESVIAKSIKLGFLHLKQIL